MPNRAFGGLAVLVLAANSCIARAQANKTAARPPRAPLRFTTATRPASPHASDIWVNPKDGSKLVYIPGGQFLMGDDDMADYGNPRHTVTLSGYWIAINCITVAQYKKYCAETGAKMPDPPNFDRNWDQDTHPMVYVSYGGARAYCKWAGVTLPSDAQWERAARGTSGRKYAWGDKFDPSQVWAGQGIGYAFGTAAVGSYGLNDIGCSDMGGNVWQWCLDWYDASYWMSRAAQGTDPVNLGGRARKSRVLRGGGWKYNNAVYFRAAFRLYSAPDIRGSSFGFRCAAGP